VNNNVPDNPVKGVLFALAAALCLASMNMIAKLLSAHLGPIEITFYRNIIALLLLVIGLISLRQLSLLKTERPWAHFFRSFIGNTGMVFCMWAVTLMPLTVFTVFLFTSPLFAALLSYPLLRERVGPYRISAIIFGFIGVYIMIKHSDADASMDLSILAIIVGLTAGLFNGAVAILLRWLGSTESTATTNFYFLFYGAIGTALALPFVQSASLPEMSIIPIIIAVGSVGLFSLLLKTQGFRLGPAALISPISYTMIIWAVIFDYFIWDRVPPWPVFAGAGIIIASNLFILWREQRVKNS